jgi:transposase
MENFDMLAENGKHTKIFESQICALLPQKKVKEISELLHISQRKIYKIISGLNLNTVQTKIEQKTLKNIVINTFSYINKKNEHYYIITDEISNTALAILQFPNKNSLNQWYQELDPEIKHNIKGISHHMTPHIQSVWKDISIMVAKKVSVDLIQVYREQFVKTYI